MAITLPGAAAAAATAPQRRRKAPLGRQMAKARWCYLFMLPNLLLMVAFTLYPTIASWGISLLDWNGFSAVSEFVGLDNYREIIGDSYFWAAFGRSFVFTGAVLPLQLAIGLFLAILLNNQALKLAPVFRTFFFLPVVTTAAVVGIVMTYVLSPFNGPVNAILTRVGLIDTPIDFLGSGDHAMATVIAVYVWKNVGMTMVYWLAALQVVPAEIYEAAKVDGASRWRQIISITLPLIAPFALIIIFISAIAALNVFPLVHTMTGGGPFYATEVMEIFIYRNAFGAENVGASRLGYASAAGVWFGIALMLIAIGQGVAMRSWRGMREQLATSGGKP